MLTPGQVLHFKTFGFLVMRDYFSAQEMDALIREFEDVLSEDHAGRPFSGKERQAVFGFVERRPSLTRLAEDDRIFEPMEQFLGPDFAWSASDGNYWVGDTQWHPDRFDLTYSLVKASFYMDEVNRHTGCLRVIPGSHRMPLYGDLKPLWRTRLAILAEEGKRPMEELDELYLPDEDRDSPAFGVLGPDIPCVALETRPGDLIFFHQNLWHTSFGGRAGRRQLAMSFGVNPTTDAQIAEVRKLHQANLTNAREQGNVDGDGLYDQRFMANESTRIRGMVARLKELGLR